MKIFSDLIKVLLLSVLLLLMYTVKITKKLFRWLSTFMDRFMAFGENGLDGEIEKLKLSIRDIVKRLYAKINK